MRPATLAFLGSCASTAPWFRFRPPDLHMVAYHNGSSLVSLMSQALRLEPSDLEGLKPAQRRQVEGDVSKSGLDVLKCDADFYVIDLCDEMCDVVRIGDSFVTNTRALGQSSFLSRFPQHELIRREAAAMLPLWKDACDWFCRGPIAGIPQDRIILHRIQLASECQRTGDRPETGGLIQGLLRRVMPWLRRLPVGLTTRRFIGRRFIGRKLVAKSQALNAGWQDVLLSNQAWSLNPTLEMCFHDLRARLPHARVIDIPPRYRFADRHHRYGVWGMHYIEAYEECFVSELRKVTGAQVDGGIEASA